MWFIRIHEYGTESEWMLLVQSFNLFKAPNCTLLFTNVFLGLMLMHWSSDAQCQLLMTIPLIHRVIPSYLSNSLNAPSACAKWSSIAKSRKKISENRGPWAFWCMDLTIHYSHLIIYSPLFSSTIGVKNRDCSWG